MKQCSKCKEIKLLSDFSKKQKHYCKICRKKESLETRLKYAELHKNINYNEPCVCFYCKKSKLISDMVFDKGLRKGYKRFCKECHKIKAIKYRKNDEVKIRIKEYKNKTKLRTKDLALQRIFKININDYNGMLNNQNGLCKICKNSNKNGRALAVDHCHKTGQIRGLLCTKCNQGLGHFDDDIYKLYYAIEYLKQSKEKLNETN